MKKYAKPQAYAAPSKDHRFEGTFEVLVPVPGRVKPQRIAQQFPTLQAAEGWLHSDEGQDAIEAALSGTAAPAPAKKAR
jgi:hypothetical protein